MPFTWIAWHTFTGQWLRNYSASFLAFVFSSLLCTMLQTTKGITVWTGQHQNVVQGDGPLSNFKQNWIFYESHWFLSSANWLTEKLLLTHLVCVTIRSCVLASQSETEGKKCWKPTKPEGVIGLSTWIFDWRKIKNSMKGNSKNKKRENQSRQKQADREGPRRREERGDKQWQSFQWLLWILSEISRREIRLVFCRLWAKGQGTQREKCISVWGVKWGILIHVSLGRI